MNTKKIYRSQIKYLSGSARQRSKTNRHKSGGYRAGNSAGIGRQGIGRPNWALAVLIVVGRCAQSCRRISGAFNRDNSDDVSLFKSIARLAARGYAERIKSVNFTRHTGYLVRRKASLRLGEFVQTKTGEPLHILPKT
jgi:hypothetical protein